MMSLACIARHKTFSALLVDGSPGRFLAGASDVPHRHPTLGDAAASGTPGVTAEAGGPLATTQPWASERALDQISPKLPDVFPYAPTRLPIGNRLQRWS